jgi:hypothetical protein
MACVFSTKFNVGLVEAGDNAPFWVTLWSCTEDEEGIPTPIAQLASIQSGSRSIAEGESYVDFNFSGITLSEDTWYAIVIYVFGNADDDFVTLGGGSFAGQDVPLFYKFYNIDTGIWSLSEGRSFGNISAAGKVAKLQVSTTGLNVTGPFATTGRFAVCFKLPVNPTATISFGCDLLGVGEVVEPPPKAINPFPSNLSGNCKNILHLTWELT